MTGIKISSQGKRDLYLLYRNTNNPKLKTHYKTYCRILSDVIKTAKKLYYTKCIINSNNKSKSIWYIVKNETKKKSNEAGPPLNIDGKTFEDYQSIPNIFNTYFTITADKMSVSNSMTMNLARNYLCMVFIRPFPHIQLTPVTTKEISEIIKSLKWKNSHGYDDTPIRILKISLPFIISPLTYTE